MSAACGNTVFVDPDQALKDTLTFTMAERLFIPGDDRSYFEVHVQNRGAIDRIRLFAEGPSDLRFELPLDGAVEQECFDKETCISLTLGPGIPTSADHMALEVPEIGHRASTLLRAVRLGGYTLSGSTLAGNTSVSVSIDDPIRHHYAGAQTANRLDADGKPIASHLILLFPRTFDAVSAPGACAEPASPSAEGWATQSMDPFTIDAHFDAGSDPATCVNVRPSLPKGGGAVATRTIGARAIISRFQHLYTPPVEVSPLVFMPLYDLELPTPERCNQAEDLVKSAILDAATELATESSMASGTDASEVLMLDPIQIADAGGVLCHQANDRSFDGGATARQIESTLVDRFGPTRRVRIILVYATNLNLDLSPQLVSAFGTLRSSFSSAAHPLHRDLLLGIAPAKPLMFLSPDRSIDWLATDEPSFKGAIKLLLRNTWPFRTVVHTDQTVVPLIGQEERGRFREYRICSTSNAINPIGAKRMGLTVLDIGMDGPAYTVSLPEEVLVESIGFSVPTVSVTWEGCESLCDHPPPSGDPNTPWERAAGCS